MDFIMRAWKRPESIWQYILVLSMTLLLWPGFACSSTAPGIDIEYAQGTLNDDTYSIDARIQYRFSEESQEALDHGVALQIDINLVAQIHRKWLWNKTIASSTLSYRLEHLPLSNNYLVTSLNDYQRRYFQDLQKALHYLGVIKNFPLLKPDIQMPENKYVARIRARLNIQALPTPLRPLAYVSSKWRLISPWYEWIIHQ